MQTRILMITTGMIFACLPVFAQTPFFWDDFDRETLLDGTDIPYHNLQVNNVSLENGSAVIAPTSDDSILTGLRVYGDAYTDVSLRAAVRFLDVGSCANNPWIGLLLRDPIDGINSSYWAGPATDGNSYIGENVEARADVLGSTGGFSCSELNENDIHLQLDAVGNTISFRSWLDGASKPADPQLEVVDDSNPWGEVVAILINPDANLTGFAVRHLALLPALDGDYNSDSEIDRYDLDLLTTAATDQPNNRVYDLDGNGVVGVGDLTTWLKLAAQEIRIGESYLFGDANLDGHVDSQDLNVVGLNWNQPVNTWSGGDFNADGFVDSTDLNFIGLNWQSSIAEPDAISVPEPSGAIWCWFAAVLWLAEHCRKLG